MAAVSGMSAVGAVDAFVSDMSLFSGKLRAELLGLSRQVVEEPVIAPTGDAPYFSSRLRPVDRATSAVEQACSPTGMASVEDVLKAARAMLADSEDLMRSAGVDMDQVMPTASVRKSRRPVSSTPVRKSSPVAQPRSADEKKAQEFVTMDSSDDDDEAPSLADFGISATTMGILAATPASAAKETNSPAMEDDDDVLRSPAAPNTKHEVLTPAALIASLSRSPASGGTVMTPRRDHGGSESPPCVKNVVQAQIDEAPSYLSSDLDAAFVNEQVRRVNELFVTKQHESGVSQVVVSQEEVQAAMEDSTGTRKVLLLLIHLNHLATAGRARYTLVE